uniref:Protein phosphatase 1 regulatory subunit 21 n=1 Tax=Ornithodoros turicata TaxID=34597 RepID=A0A2R5L7F5_9ACAR
MEGQPPSDGGLSAKYQKLALEYSKIRAQAQVLKKAVSDEQARNADLKDALKEREQTIRKIEQEVESLNFCNHQLTKRVSFLQEELERDRASKNKKKHGTSPLNQGVIDCELQNRIQENEKLHLQVSSAEVEHKRVVENLECQLEEAQRAVALRESALNEIIRKQEADVDRLTQDRARLELKLRNCEKDLKSALINEEACRNEVEFLQSSLGERLNDATQALAQATSFRDNAVKKLNALNVPVVSEQHTCQVRQLLMSLAEAVPETVQAISTLHTYMEQRVRLLHASSTQFGGLLLVFARHLHSNVSYLQPIEEAYQNYFDHTTKEGLYLLNGGQCVAEMSDSISKYVCYLNKLLPYTVITAGLCSTSEKSQEWRAQLKCTSQKIVAKFNQLDRYFRLLSVPRDDEGGSHSAGYTTVVNKIVGAVRSICTEFDGAKRQLSALLVVEHDMPTVSVESKTTDDCILNSLVAVVTCLRKITKALEQHSKVLLADSPYYQRGVRKMPDLAPLPTCHLSPVAPRLKQRGSAYISLCLTKEPPESIPYKTAVRNSCILKNNVNSQESLVQQLENCRSKVRKLEEEKVHWKLEWQLLQAKFQRETKEALHSGDGLHQENGSSEGAVIAAHLKSRIKDLIEQGQQADSRAVYFHAECKALEQRLHSTEQARNALQTELQELKAAFRKLKEESGVTTRNYEDQLSSMSEHLASMNEKLTQQKDEIDALRHSNKVGKKLK